MVKIISKVLDIKKLTEQNEGDQNVGFTTYGTKM